MNQPLGDHYPFCATLPKYSTDSKQYLITHLPLLIKTRLQITTLHIYSSHLTILEGLNTVPRNLLKQNTEYTYPP